jgi:hypothetical protein
MVRVNRGRRPHQVEAFLLRAAPFPPHEWIDIDEMKQVPKDFEQKYGYSQEGNPAIATQFIIGTRAFSVIAGMESNGFNAWTITENENINHTHVEEFIRTKIAPIAFGKRGLVDNASSHHMADVRAALDAAFAGRWLYSSPYSPHLKPIERGFKLIKDFIQLHEVEAIADPITWINSAFQEYSVGGPQGHVCRGFWNVYVRLHQSFQDGLV